MHSCIYQVINAPESARNSQEKLANTLKVAKQFLDNCTFRNWWENPLKSLENL